MSIATYSELQSAVQGWVDITDTGTLPVARVQECIALAEADINRRLRTRSQVSSASDVVTAGVATITLPSGFAGVRSLAITNGSVERPLEQMAPRAAMEAYAGYGTGEPRHYDIEGGNLRLWPTPDSAYTYTLRYWARVPALSDSATTNWLLTSHPDVYLYGALAATKGFLMDDERLAVWRAQYESALESVQQQSHADSFGQTFSYVSGGTP